jgi:hypothetical protein
VRLLRGLLRLVGWLLTPLVAWVASFGGAWLGAAIGGWSGSSTVALGVTVALGGLSGLVAAWGWLRFLRRSPRLRETLAVAPDGTPLVAIQENPPKEPP